MALFHHARMLLCRHVVCSPRLLNLDPEGCHFCFVSLLAGMSCTAARNIASGRLFSLSESICCVLVHRGCIVRDAMAACHSLSELHSLEPGFRRHMSKKHMHHPIAAVCRLTCKALATFKARASECSPCVSVSVPAAVHRQSTGSQEGPQGDLYCSRCMRAQSPCPGIYLAWSTGGDVSSSGDACNCGDAFFRRYASVGFALQVYPLQLGSKCVPAVMCLLGGTCLRGNGFTKRYSCAESLAHAGCPLGGTCSWDPVNGHACAGLSMHVHVVR